MISATGLEKARCLTSHRSVESRIVLDLARETKTTFLTQAAIVPDVVPMNPLTTAKLETSQIGRERVPSLHRLQLRHRAEKDVPEPTMVHNFGRLPLPGERAVLRMALDHQDANIKIVQLQREPQPLQSLTTSGDRG